MRALSSTMTHSCSVAHVRASAPPKTAPSPTAIAGARIARDGRDRIEPRSLVAALVDVFVDPAPDPPPTVFSVTRSLDAEPLAQRGTTPFDEALALAQRLRPSDAPLPFEDALSRCLDAVERAARLSFAAPIERATRGAQLIVNDTIELCLDTIDEAPIDRRERLATSARSLIEATVTEWQPTLVLAARAVICTSSLARVARWRLSGDAGWAWIESESQQPGVRLFPRCPQCRERDSRWALCDRCVDARCARCARRCTRCRRTACASCATSARCWSCGFATMEVVRES